MERIPDRFYIYFLFATTFITRAWSAYHGHPFSYHNDEHWIFKPGLMMIEQHTWDPNWYVYPPLLVILFKIFVTPFLWIIPLSIHIPEAWTERFMLLPHQFPVLYIGRLICVFFGSATVVFLYKILKPYTSKIFAGSIAFLFSISSTVIFFSSYLRPEPLIVFFLILNFYFLIRYQNSSDNRSTWTWIAGIALGMGVGSKYNAIFFLLPNILFFCMTDPKCKNIFFSTIRLITGMLIGFCISAPQFLWKPSVFFVEAQHDYQVYMDGQLGNSGSFTENFQFYVSNLLPIDKFGMIFILFLISLAFLYFVRNKMDRFKFTVAFCSSFFIVSYFIFILMFSYRAERVIVLIHPFLFITVGLTLHQIQKNMCIQKFSFVPLMLAVVFLIQGYESYKYLVLCNQPLPQDEAMTWIYEHTKQNDIIAKEFGSPFIDPYKYVAISIYSIANVIPDQLMKINPKYIILSSNVGGIVNTVTNTRVRSRNQWFWSKMPEYEVSNDKGIPLGEGLRIIDFQKYKQEFKKTFINAKDLVN